MKKAAFAIVLGAAVTTVLLFCFQRFRIQPLNDSSPPNHQRVRKAKDAFCSREGGNTASRLIYVEAVDDAGRRGPLVRINHETMPVSQAQKQLHSIYAVRADRVVFVVSSPDAASRGQFDVINLVQHVDTIEDVCIIDPKSPPTWYPPQEIVYPASRLQ
ncbi:MAG TPA: hypothetical protein VFT65_16665 [Candidatus Angelobacter sp.]|nr:hypothetical protein [Candidatus Angelobacter sp.]